MDASYGPQAELPSPTIVRGRTVVIRRQSATCPRSTPVAPFSAGLGAVDDPCRPVPAGKRPVVEGAREQERSIRTARWSFGKCWLAILQPFCSPGAAGLSPAVL